MPSTRPLEKFSGAGVFVRKCVLLPGCRGASPRPCPWCRSSPAGGPARHFRRCRPGKVTGNFPAACHGKFSRGRAADRRRPFVACCGGVPRGRAARGPPRYFRRCCRQAGQRRRGNRAVSHGRKERFAASRRRPLIVGPCRRGKVLSRSSLAQSRRRITPATSRRAFTWSVTAGQRAAVPMVSPRPCHAPPVIPGSSRRASWSSTGQRVEVPACCRSSPGCLWRLVVASNSVDRVEGLPRGRVPWWESSRLSTIPRCLFSSMNLGTLV